MVVPAGAPAEVRSSHSGSRKQMYLAGLASSGKVCPVSAAAPQVAEAKVEDGSERNWADLPEALLEKILSHVRQSSELQVPKAMFPACGVCSSWRAAGLRLFFTSPWQDGGSICHPAGLFLLTPPDRLSSTCSSGGSHHSNTSASSSAAAAASQQVPTSSPGSINHVKCYVRREVVSSGLTGRLHKFTLFQGSDFAAGDGKFLLSALQESKQRYVVHLNRALSGRPCARLASNVMRTAYNLTPERSAWMDGITAQQAQQTQQALQQQQWQEGLRTASDAAGASVAADGAASCSGQQASSSTGASCSTAGASSSSALGRLSSSGLGLVSSSSLGRSSSIFSTVSASNSLSHSHSNGHTSEEGSWAEEPIARVHYKLRVRGMMLPRRMSVSLPCPPHLQQHLLQQQLHEGCEQHACGCGMPHEQQQGQHGHQWQHGEQDVPVPMLDMDDDLLHEMDQDVGPHGMHVAAEAASAGAAGPSAPAGGAGAMLQLERRSHLTESPSPTPPSPRSQPHCAAAGAAAGAAAAAAGGAAAAGAGAGAAGPAALKLKNKPPHWNETLRCWCLNFRGRVKLASVKNFQLTVAGDNTGAIAMQFGKVDKNAFILDFNPALVTAAQAFAVALTTFESKVLL